MRVLISARRAGSLTRGDGCVSCEKCGLGYYLFFPLTFAPCWLTLTLMPATVTLQLRPLLVFCAAVTFAAPLKVPVPVAVTHDVPDEDDQEHPLVVVTVSVLEPPAAEKLTEVGVTEYVQGGGGGAGDDPSVAARNCATIEAVWARADALLWEDVPIGNPLYKSDGLEKNGTLVAVPYDITVRKMPPGSW
jgi:hypothetical protein